jgi:hypothetical protein
MSMRRRRRGRRGRRRRRRRRRSVPLSVSPHRPSSSNSIRILKTFSSFTLLWQPGWALLVTTLV